MTLPGRLGLETASIPHADCDGLAWLSRCRLWAADGALRFQTAGGRDLEPGDYAMVDSLSGKSCRPEDLHLLFGVSVTISGQNWPIPANVPPQARGWTDSVPCFCMLVMVSPASAGMDLLGGGSQ